MVELYPELGTASLSGHDCSRWERKVIAMLHLMQLVCCRHQQPLQAALAQPVQLRAPVPWPELHRPMPAPRQLLRLPQ